MEQEESNMSYCPKCGNKVDETMAFCPSCGASLKGHHNSSTGTFSIHSATGKSGEKHETGENRKTDMALLVF